MFYAALKTLHVLAIILWLGGMAFTLFFLRPAVNALEPALRLALMRDVLRPFFAAVLGSIVVILVTGAAMMGLFAGTSSSMPDGQRLQMPWTWMAMAGLGVLMALIFGHIRYVLFKRLQLAVAENAWTSGAAAMASIRIWVRANLSIGLLIVVLVVGFS